MQDKVVVITGASSGIGKALAEFFGTRGSKLVLTARHTDKLSDVEKSLKAKGVEVLSVRCDVSIEEDCRQLIASAVNAFGTVDVLINNAGISMRALFADLDLQVIRKLMDTNFWGTVYCTKYALPYLLKNKGSIVGVSSIAGKKGLPGRTGYSASKFAMEGFLETLRNENLRNGLHVLVACPGFTASNIRSAALSKDGTMQGGSPRNEQSMMQPEEVAEAIYNAVQRRRRDLILTTSGKITFWMNKFFPAWIDKLVYKHMSKEPDSPFK